MIPSNGLHIKATPLLSSQKRMTVRDALEDLLVGTYHDLRDEPESNPLLSSRLRAMELLQRAEEYRAAISDKLHESS